LEKDRLFQSIRSKLEIQKSQRDDLTNFLSKPPEKRLKPITEVTIDLVASVKHLWLSTLDADLARRREGLDDDEYDELQTNISSMKLMIGSALARGDVKIFIPPTRALFTGRGYELKLSPEAERLLVLDVLPALQEGYDILEQRQQGRQVKPDFDPSLALPAVWEEPPVPSLGLSWDKLFEHWKHDRDRPEQTVRDAASYLSSIRQAFPKSTPATFTRGLVTAWLRQERELRNNKPKTLEKKGTLMGAMFSVAVKDELLDKNPFAGFDYKRFAAKEGVEDKEARLPFNKAELKRIFSSEEGVVSPQVVKLQGGGGYYARVWLPAIALLSGARLDEIGSLTVHDVIAGPIPHFKVRRGKTHSSVREVPLHPELIRIGFLQYVDAIKKAGHQSLWPDMKSGSQKTKNSEVLGKWFNNYLHKALKLPSTVVFHSFRHTFKDFCRDALIPREIHHAISGHEDSEQQNVGDTYGLGFSIGTKHKEISKIKLGFELPTPRVYTAKA
jgi:integrase